MREATISLMRDIDERFRDLSGLSERRFYSIFYSRIDPADVLVLGINPGGDPNSWKEDSLASQSYYENFEHEYVDCKYAIQEPMLPFLMNVLAVSSEGVRHVPKSNLAFRRSNGVDEFKQHHGITITAGINEAKPFVEEIIAHVAPKIVILEGMTTYDTFKQKYCERRNLRDLCNPITAAWRGKTVRVFSACELTMLSTNTSAAIIGVGHPSHFGKNPVFKSVEGKAREIASCYL